MNRRNTSVNTHSNSARAGGRACGDAGRLCVASGTQLHMIVNEVISNVCDAQVPTQHLWGAQIESADANRPIGIDRLRWGRPEIENRIRS
jgi:hypothetical protein